MEHQPKYPKYSESQGQVQWTVRMMVRPLTNTGNERLSQTTKTVNLREFTP